MGWNGSEDIVSGAKGQGENAFGDLLRLARKLGWCMGPGKSFMSLPT